MSTVAQVLANQANAQQSTGPRAPLGTAACRHNATTHGLTGKQIVIKGEDPQAFDDLRSKLQSQHRPANELEAMLVEQIAQNWWRLSRARSIEAKMLDEFGALDAFQHKAFLNLQRQLARVESAWNRAIRDLAKLQRIRHQHQQEAQLQQLQRDRASKPHTPSRIGSVFAANRIPPSAQPTARQYKMTRSR